MFRIKQHYKDTRTYEGYNFHSRPDTWTFENQIRQDVNDHIDAVHQAVDDFTRRDMISHAKIISNKAEAETRGVSVQKVESEELQKEFSKFN